MPTPLPDPELPLMGPPDRDEVIHITRGLKGAMQPEDGLTELQTQVLSALTASMTGYDIDVEDLDPIGPVEFAAGLSGRDLRFRTEMVHAMDLGHMLLDTPDLAVADRVIEYATELSVATEPLQMARALAEGSAQLVAADIDRSGYISNLDLSGFTPLETEDDHVWAWTNTVVNPELADRWRALGDLAEGTLGRAVHDFYRARGFHFPGEEGSVPPILAQHDWVHVLADYGSQLEAEIEGSAFMARASDNPEAFALLGMAITLFHTGLLPAAAGFFEADRGNMAKDGMPDRLGDALRRGALCIGSIDYLALDYFSMADRSIEDIHAEFGIEPKSERAVIAGSTGPFEPGGISEAQLEAGSRLAAEQGRPYETFGAVAERREPAMSSSEGREFFEAMYSKADGDESLVPWQDAISRRFFDDWLQTFDPSGHRRGLVVAAGLGDDAAALDALGLEVVAFDHAPSAVEWARSRHPDSTIEWRVADLFSPPTDWIGAFDLVVEVFTVQSIDPTQQVAAAEAVRSFVAPDGTLLAVALIRRGDEPPTGPPWPLHHSTLEALGEGWRTVTHRTEELDDGLSCVLVELSRPDHS